MAVLNDRITGSMGLQPQNLDEHLANPTLPECHAFIGERLGRDAAYWAKALLACAKAGDMAIPDLPVPGTPRRRGVGSGGAVLPF